MSSKSRLRLAALLAALSLPVAWVGFGQTIIATLPEEWRPFVSAALPVLAILLAYGAIWLLWDLASKAAVLEEVAKDALRVAEDEKNALTQRIEAAEAKLVKALDEGVIDWSPAYQRLADDAGRRIGEHTQGGLNIIRDAYNSFRRRAERGYLEGDDIGKPPPPITPQDI